MNKLNNKKVNIDILLWRAHKYSVDKYIF